MKARIHPLLILLIFILSGIFRANADERVALSVDGRNVSADEFMYLYNKNRMNGDTVSTARDYARMFAVFKMKVIEAELAGLDTTRQFRAELAGYLRDMGDADPMLVKEYREGMLLFEISNLMVWQKATADTEALERQFAANRERYGWDAPRAKGWIISAADSATAVEAQTFLAEANVDNADLRPLLKRRFGMKVKAEKYLVREGVNQIVDRLVFQQENGFVAGNDWALSWSHDCRVISAPEEWSDVGAMVTADYQDLLAQQWEESLWQSHDVVFNYDVIDEITSV